MRPITRQEALRLCKTHSVLVEVSVGGYKSHRALTPRSPLYEATGHFDFRNLRYFLVLPIGASRGTGPSSLDKPGSGQSGQGTGSEEPLVEPREVNEEHETFSVRIMAENGKDPAPTEILPGTSVKFRAVPNKGGGKYEWKTSSKILKFDTTSGSIVTVSVDAKSQGKKETLELFFTPAGSGALGPVNHVLTVARVIFGEHQHHAWGYDEAGVLPCEDLNGTQFFFNTDSNLDRVSVEKEKVGVVSVHYDGLEANRLFFTAKDGSTCDLKPRDAGANPIILEIHARGFNFKETRIEARLGSLTGPIAAEIELTIMRPISYGAKYFRMFDPDSPKSRLKTKASPADIEKALNRLYKPGIAEWTVTGSEKDIECRFDFIKNGALNLEPGVVSKELSRIKAAIDMKGGVPIVHVHALNYSYFLAADAKPKDTRILLKKYGPYLDFIGNVGFRLEDSKGKSTTVIVKSVDKSTGEVTLTAPLGVELKVAYNAALIWPLGGLSGFPTLICDIGTHADLMNYAAHELGHTQANFRDLAEVDNVMFGGYSTGVGIRGRAIPLFYKPKQKESQWKKMLGR